jgi:hypothetical protein
VLHKSRGIANDFGVECAFLQFHQLLLLPLVLMIDVFLSPGGCDTPQEVVRARQESQVALLLSQVSWCIMKAGRKRLRHLLLSLLFSKLSDPEILLLLITDRELQASTRFQQRRRVVDLWGEQTLF